MLVYMSERIGMWSMKARKFRRCFLEAARMSFHKDRVLCKFNTTHALTEPMINCMKLNDQFDYLHGTLSTNIIIYYFLFFIKYELTDNIFISIIINSTSR